jgi:hypothetical protein
MRKSILHIFSSCLLAWVLFVSAGCDNVIEPLSENADAVFSINGFLDSAADTQFVRISGLRSTILANEPDLSDVRVSSIDSETARIEEWRDSLVTLDDGSTGHLFYVVFRPSPGHLYTLRVRRGDGERAEATTRLPDKPDLLVSPPLGDTLALSQLVLLRGLDIPPTELRILYRVAMPEEEDGRDILIGYGESGKSLSEGWQFEVFLKRDQSTILRILGLERDDTGVRLIELGVKFSIPSREWEEVFNPTNLSMAHGFFGSVARYELGWTLDADAVRTIGFVDDQLRN